jgi:hypothetical protein
VLRTRAPLSPKASFDLHVLGMPPAFVLSQDQTLKFMTKHRIVRPIRYPFKESFLHITITNVSLA